MTTAEYRKQAFELESQQQYAAAAYCWQEAIKAYPIHAGALAQRDLAQMESRRLECARGSL